VDAGSLTKTARQALLNSFVHSVMYIYYFLTSIGIQPPGKFLVTWLQQIQFLTMLGQCAYGYMQDCSRPRIYMYALSVYLVSMLALFANYQINEYVLKRNDGKRAAKTAREAASMKKVE
jgi:elongation of very long chain fatty acids protein 4